MSACIKINKMNLFIRKGGKKKFHKHTLNDVMEEIILITC